jgi:hypothetical protein
MNMAVVLEVEWRILGSVAKFVPNLLVRFLFQLILTAWFKAYSYAKR